MRARLPSGCAVLLVAATGHGIGAPGQVQGVPGHVSWTVASREVSKYEGLYGETLFVSLELLVGPLAREADVPARRTIRTSGLFYVIDKPGGVPACSLCTEEHDCLSLDRPTRDIADAFFSGATFRNGEAAEVVGAFGVPEDGASPATGTTAGASGFVFWSFASGPARERGAAGGGMTLEQLVRAPRQHEGRTITVRGVFRGANLFEDLPPESRRDAGDWVLRDGPFFIWVTGHAPRGKGFSLDPASRESAAYRLEVEGRPAVRGGLVYLRASEVRLLGRVKDPGP
jgi:hypothetical protein